MAKPILCLDFDGVIHSYSSGWKGSTVIPDPPVRGALQFMLDALLAGWDVVVHSSRARHIFGPMAMKGWLYRHAIQKNIWYDHGFGPGLEDVRFVRFKPSAVITIDDRALTFTGKFPQLTELKTFQPWYRRPTAMGVAEQILQQGASIRSITGLDANPRNQGQPPPWTAA